MSDNRFYIKRPSSLVSQARTFSAYKNDNSQVLISIPPNGAISFVSKCYEGSISDSQDLLTPLGIQLNVPPFLTGRTQMASSDVIIAKKIAHLRVHVERAIGRVKEYTMNKY